VGYSGGDSENPSYSNLGNHSETVEIDYDPSQISYERLLDVFWSAHYPTMPSWSRQYMSAVFYHNDEQKRLAEESRIQQETERGKIYTEILPYTGFHLAEDYHQKYYLQNVEELAKEIRAVYPDTGDLVNSTAAARLNGYAGGYGIAEDLQEELNSYGLTAQGNEKLLELADKGLSPACPIPLKS
jgi:peptide-methionine (S)-S-oxide reductase